MPISATGIWIAKPELKRCQHGFTLLEVMVTLVLIGIITSFAILSLPGDNQQHRLHDEAKRLHALLELNQQEAVMLGQQRGVLLSEHTYQFVQLDAEQQWQPLQDSELLQAHTLATDIRLLLNTEGRLSSLNTDKPQILLLSSGETNDFAITLSTATLSGYQINGDLSGTIRLQVVQ